MPGQGGGPGELFEQFLAWKQAQDASTADDGMDVPLFEKTKDGAERSATLPWRHARPLLESWGWLQPEEGGDGSTGEGQADGTPGGARGFIQSLAGGQGRATSPAAPGKPRKAAG